MKKLPALLLALSLLSLSACGGQEPAPTPTPSPSSAPSEAQEKTVLTAMPAFTTTDLEGNEVTSDIFAQKDLTVVNLWGTFCTPCINEMPELAAWSGELPDNVQLIGIVCDLSAGSDRATYDLAVDIVTRAGVTFPCLLACEDMNDLLGAVVGVPTTIFVDREGNLVGQAVLGAYVEQYKATVEELLNGQT